MVELGCCCRCRSVPLESPIKARPSPSQDRACLLGRLPADRDTSSSTTTQRFSKLLELRPSTHAPFHSSSPALRGVWRSGTGIGELGSNKSLRDMATPTQQSQPYGGSYPTPASSGGPPSAQQQQPAYTPSERPPTAAQAQFQQQQASSVASSNPPFEKYCIIHIATTCDEHGVYVTKDSAEVIEIGWVVVDAQNPEREVRVQRVESNRSSAAQCLACETRHGKNRPAWARMLIKRHCSCTASPCSSALSTLPSRRCVLPSPL